MTDFDFSEFKQKVTADEMDAMDSLEESTGEYVPVPYGAYEVRVSSLKLGKSKAGNPTVKMKFKVINGEYKGKVIYYNKSVFGQYYHWAIKQVGQLMTSMKTEMDVSSRQFIINGEVDYNKYRDLLQAVYDDITARGLEYHLDYAQDDKGYDTYTIAEVYYPKEDGEE